MDQSAGNISPNFNTATDGEVQAVAAALPKSGIAMPRIAKSGLPLTPAHLLYWAPSPELGLAAVYLFAALLISAVADLPFSLPDASALAFTGMHPAVPFGLIGAWAVLTIFSRHKLRIFYYMAGALAYGTILIAHFNIKLWMNVINPVRWDAAYWRSDQAIRPMIDASFMVHDAVAKIVPFENHLYLFAFLAMFVSSIVVHSMRCFLVFRRVIFTAMLVHALGAFSYWIAPAVGPFIYEAGNNAVETARQVHMFEGYQALMAGGRPWIAEYGPQYMLAAVAAMPSLHVASSGVFLYYAWKHERWLGLCYLPLFTFILFEAVATRWHYAADLLGGLALTAIAITIAAAIFGPIERHRNRAAAADQPSSQ